MKIRNVKKKGFTLVEIMIVVVIIGLLAALAIPAFNKVRQTSQEKAIKNNLRQLYAASQQYFLESGETSAAFAALVGSDKWIKSITTAAKEDYTGITITSGASSVTVAATSLPTGVVGYYP